MSPSYPTLEDVLSRLPSARRVGVQYKALGFDRRPGARAEPERWTLDATYIYTDEQDRPLYRIKRLKRPDGSKTFRAERHDASRWIGGAGCLDGVRRVLYRLPQVRAAAESGSIIIVEEGEKDADALAARGLVATTNSGGASVRWPADFTQHFHGAESVAVIPDNDDAGYKHARRVARLLHRDGLRVQLLDALPGVGEKGDVSDWIAQGGTKEALLALIDKAPLYEGGHEPEDGAEDAASEAQDAPEDSWEPPTPFYEDDLPAFPVDALPQVVRAFVAAESIATQTPADLPAMSTLPVLAAACARKYEVQVAPGYREPLNHLAAVAMPPGSRKSAVFSDTTAPMTAWEEAEAIRRKPEIQETAARRRVLERAKENAEAKAAKAEDEAARAALFDELRHLHAEPNALPPVVAPRLYADDVTPEKLANLMAIHDERILLASPQGGVFGQMAGRYSSGGVNLEIYLKGHAGDALRVDRVSRDPDLLRRPALSIALAVQPDVFRSLGDTPEFKGRGVTARFLYGMPKSIVGSRLVNPPPVPTQVRDAYHRTVAALLQLPLRRGPDGQIEPWLLGLTADAAAEHRGFAEWIEPQLGPIVGAEALPLYPARVARPLALAHALQRRLDAGEFHDQAEMARALGFTRARVTQLLDLLLLAPDIQEEILFLECPAGRQPIHEAQLRPIVRAAFWSEQRRRWHELSRRKAS